MGLLDLLRESGLLGVPPIPSNGVLTNNSPQSMADPPTARATFSTQQLQDSDQYEADQAQLAREASAERLVRGVRSLTRAAAPPLDPIDMAKSAGIGVINGVINGAGLIGGDLPTGFGYLPNNLLINGARRLAGYPDLPADEPDWIRDRVSADAIRHGIEKHTGEFYQPHSRTGRYIETIGEFSPLTLLGAGLAVLRGGAGLAGTGLRYLGRNLATDAVAPGTVVQTLEEAYPDSQAGQAIQKAYPAFRRGLPLALAVKRYLGSRVAPQGGSRLKHL